MILVTGATGHLGHHVVAALLNKVPANQIVAGVRDLAKAEDLTALGVEVRVADYEKPESFDTALQGVEKVLLISSNAVGQREAQHRVVIEAAKKAGVKLLAYTSILHADKSPLLLAKEHLATEKALTASGVPFVLLRNGWYTENYTANIKPSLEHGAMPGSAGEGRISAATRAEYAEAAAMVLTSSEDQAGKIYELAGDSAFTPVDFVAEVSKQSGKPLAYANLPKEELAKVLTSIGLPQQLSDILADADEWSSKDELYDDSRQLSQLIGRPTANFADAVAEALNS